MEVEKKSCIGGLLFMFNNIVFPWEEEEQGGQEREESGSWGRPEVVFLVKLICKPQCGGEGDEVQMENCLVGDEGGGDGGWG